MVRNRNSSSPRMSTRLLAIAVLSVMGCWLPSAQAGDANLNKLIRDLGDKNAMTQRRAAEALGKLGPRASRAVPKLLETIKTDYAPVRGAAVNALGKIGKAAIPGLIKTMRMKHTFAGPATTEALGLIGVPAVEPLRVVIRKEKDKDVRNLALGALQKIGKKAVPATSDIVKLLGNGDSGTSAAHALAAIGPAARAAIPELLKHLKGRRVHHHTKFAILSALATIGPAAPKEVLACLKAAAKNKNGHWALTAARGLGNLGAAGAEAVPELLHLLTYTNPRWGGSMQVRYAAYDALAKMGPAAREKAAATVVTHLGSSDKTTNRKAIAALTAMGPKVAPHLEKGVTDRNERIRFNSARVLGGLGAAGLKGLTEALGDERRSVQIEALEQLGNIGPAAVPVLAKMLERPDRDLRLGTVKSLGRIGKAALPSLIRAFNDKDAAVRRAAVEQAAGLGKNAVSSLAKVANTAKAPLQKLGALKALSRMGTKARSAAPACQAALGSKHNAVKTQASLTLIAIGGSGIEKTIPIAVKSLENANADIRVETCRALGVAGPKAASAVSALVHRLKDDHWEVRDEAATALGKIGSPASVAVIPLADAIVANQVWYSGVMALQKLGKAAHPAAPKLIEAVKTSKVQNVRLKSAQALGKMKPPVEAAVPALIQLRLGRSDRILNTICINALSNIRTMAIPHLIEGLKHKDKAVRDRCAQALGQIGPEARAAVPLLTKLVMNGSDKWSAWSRTSSWALGRIGPAAAPAIGELMKLLKVADRYHNDAISRARGAAVTALAGIGKPAASKIPELRQLMKKEKDRGVRAAIERAIVQLDAARDGE